MLQQMARNRKKNYIQGDRINIYLSRDIPPTFIEWINKQSDLSSFFLFAARKLYEDTGFVDVSEIMPRKINFDLALTDKSPRPLSTLTETETEEEPIIELEERIKPNANQKLDKIPLEDSNELEESLTEENNKNEAWANISDLDDPFA